MEGFMKKLLVAFVAVFMAVALVVPDVEAARRAGGGRSTGVQRPNNATQQTTPAAPTAANSMAASQQRSGMSRWMAPLAGLAAGLGLAYLFGDQMGSILMALLVVAAVVVIAMLALRFLARNKAQPALQGAGASTYKMNQQHAPVAPKMPASGAAAAPQLAAPAVPANFDVNGFIGQAKQAFLAVQAANDRGDLDALREMSTDQMFDTLKSDVLERKGASQSVEIVELNADLVEVVTEGNMHWASVRYSGKLREDGAMMPSTFTEMWNLRKPIDGSSGWLLAGIQQLS
jgi:predicted lipid-binding transport protein (Tim44 family)